MEFMALTGLITAFGVLAAWATRPSHVARASAIREQTPRSRSRPRRDGGRSMRDASLSSALPEFGIALLGLLGAG
jgi:hypothetical protein